MTSTRYAVSLDRVGGPVRTIDVAEGETVLEAARRAGTSLPYGCRTGACGTCVGRLLAVAGTAGGDDATENADAAGETGDDEGAINVADAFAYRREPRALKPRHRDGGYVLLCIATPRANSRVAAGSRVQSELVDNPWK